MVIRVRCFRCVALVFALLIWALPVSGAQPLGVICFTGNSFGEFQACPTCGKGALGGLGRRAGLFEKVRAESTGALFVSGGYEFASYIKRREVRGEVMPALAEAYGLMRYDVGLVMPVEVAALRDAGAALPGGFDAARGAVWTRVLERGGLKYGFVCFPRKDAPYDRVTQVLKQAATDAARELRPSVDVVVGLSPWGERDELAYAREFPGIFDILLGAGPGTGYGVRSVEGRTVWVRPPFDGRGVIRLDVLALPDKEGERQWREGVEYAYAAVELGSDVHADASVSNLFAWF